MLIGEGCRNCSIAVRASSCHKSKERSTDGHGPAISKQASAIAQSPHVYLATCTVGVRVQVSTGSKRRLMESMAASVQGETAPAGADTAAIIFSSSLTCHLSTSEARLPPTHAALQFSQTTN
jgi:hypothetical protein